MANNGEAEDGNEGAAASEQATPPPPRSPEGLGKRLSGMRRARGARPRGGALDGNGPLIVAGALAVLFAGGIYAVASITQEEEVGTLVSSEVETFQSPTSGRGRIVFPEDEIDLPEPSRRIEVPTEDELAPEPTPAAARPKDALASTLADLRRELREEAEARERAAQDALDAQRALAEERQAASDEALAEARRDAEAARREAADLLSALEAERTTREALDAQLRQEEDDMAARAEAAEHERALQEEQRMRQAEMTELRERQVVSPAVVFAEGDRGGGAAGQVPSPVGAATGASEGATPTGAEAFLASAPPLVVQEAKRMTDPDRTLAQGSVIQAVLQGVVSSEMPGDVVAVVSEPVPAFSGDAILVPRGSRLFGSYRAGMEAGQRRVLIRWERILTPDGTSMEISSVGGDGLGRSGLSGFVDRRLRERLGTAALISVITAAPGLAASGGGEGTDLVLDTGGDVGGQATSALDDQLAIPPTIHVPQGAAVTVIVDRDVIVR